jgi:hypothetical protein
MNGFPAEMLTSCDPNTTHLMGRLVAVLWPSPVLLWISRRWRKILSSELPFPPPDKIPRARGGCLDNNASLTVDTTPAL